MVRRQGDGAEDAGDGLMGKKGLEEFEGTFGKSKIDELKAELEVERKKVEALAESPEPVSIKEVQGDDISFAVVSDTHFGSLYAHPNAFVAFCEYVVSRGIDTMYIAGDVIDGHGIYKGQEFELRDVGLDAQIDRLVAVCKPIAKLGLNNSFITGNHDMSFKKLVGVNVGALIEETTGWRHIGDEQGDIVYKTKAGDYKVRLLHPGGGSSYALSYRPQKIIESLEGGSKPNMICIGHYHKAMVMPSYRNMTAILAGTFQKQTPFMARGALAAHVGGWVIAVGVGKGSNRIMPEFVAFYK